MTEHEKIKQKLEPFVDNELSEPERKLVEAHLQQCPVCQHEVAVLTKLHHLTKQTVPKPEPDYTEHLAGQVWLKIRKQERARTKARLFWIPRLAPILAGAATLILVAVIGIKFLSTTSRAKKIIEPTGLPSMAGAIKDEDKGLTDKIETSKVEELRTSVARAKKSEIKEPAQLQTEKSATIEKTDLAGKGEEIAEAKKIEPRVIAARPIYRREQKDAEMMVAVPAEEPETIGAKKGEEEFTQAEILEEQPEPESTKIESILTGLATPSQRAELAEKGEITQYFVVGIEPVPIYIAQPKYPKSAQEKKLEGEAVIKVIVGLDGEVEYTEVLKSSGYGILDSAALEAAQNSKFKPVFEKGKKVRTLTTIPFKFPNLELVFGFDLPVYAIKIPKPEYPKLAKEKMLEGKVVIEALVDTNGVVIATKVNISSGYGILDTSALKAAEISKFRPARKRGKIVQGWVMIPFEFSYPEK